MGIRILRIGIMDIVCSNQRDIQLPAHPEQFCVDCFLLRNPVILQFQKIIPLAEACLILSGSLSCLLRHPLYNIPLHLSRQTGRKRNNSLMILIQNLHIHTGLIIITFRKALADNLHQICISCIVFRQQNQMVISVLAPGQFLVKTGIWRHIYLTAQNRINPLRSGGAVKINYTVHNAMVCNGSAVHTQFPDPGNIFLNFVGTVQKGIFRVDMKMYKGHVLLSLSLLFPVTLSKKAPPKNRECLFLLNLYYRYFFNKSTLSVASQGREISSLPKCP